VSNLRIGTSGWNYPGGSGTWNGLFYPAAAGRRKRAGGRKFDELTYYAEHFDTVEINTTFYGPPRANVAAGWADRTPPGFEFSLKLYKELTHAGTPGPPQIDSDLVDEYRRGVEPLADAGKLGALLAQFPPSFKQTPESCHYLDQLLTRFGDYPIAVELRHRSWSDDFTATLALLNSHHAALTQIDEPKFQLSIRQNQLPNVTGFYYMRLHGRNAAQWWKHDKAEDRYNYLYSDRELQAFSETAGAARRLVKKLYLYFNNHFASKAVVNAVMIKHKLGEPVPGAYPPALVERYPEIASIVTTRVDPQLSPLGR
jgi:uncharacterized protein YecE (DUF72 family)